MEVPFTIPVVVFEMITNLKEAHSDYEPWAHLTFKYFSRDPLVFRNPFQII